MHSSFVFKVSVGMNETIILSDHVCRKDNVATLKNAVYMLKNVAVLESVSIDTEYVNSITTSTHEECYMYENTIAKSNKHCKETKDNSLEIVDITKKESEVIPSYDKCKIRHAEKEDAWKKSRSFYRNDSLKKSQKNIITYPRHNTEYSKTRKDKNDSSTVRKKYFENFSYGLRPIIIVTEKGKMKNKK
jgi:hypothetical protein